MKAQTPFRRQPPPLCFVQSVYQARLFLDFFFLIRPATPSTVGAELPGTDLAWPFLRRPKRSCGTTSAPFPPQRERHFPSVPSARSSHLQPSCGRRGTGFYSGETLNRSLETGSSFFLKDLQAPVSYVRQKIFSPSTNILGRVSRKLSSKVRRYLPSLPPHNIVNKVARTPPFNKVLYLYLFFHGGKMSHGS